MERLELRNDLMQLELDGEGRSIEAEKLKKKISDLTEKVDEIEVDVDDHTEKFKGLEEDESDRSEKIEKFEKDYMETQKKTYKDYRLRRQKSLD